MYLIAAGRCDDPAELKRRPGLWRRVRRFNLPVQLAVAAAEEVAAAAEDPASAALLSLAPCHSGSPDLFGAVLALSAAERAGHGGPVGTPRVNPVVTLHAVDNLALSALAITFGNHGYGLGLGGGPGQAWVALEIARERFADRRESEILVIAGDQTVAAGDAGSAVALLFRDRPADDPGRGKAWRLAGVERVPGVGYDVEPHAADGLVALLDVLEDATGDRLVYRVPGAHGDGRDRLELRWQAA